MENFSDQPLIDPILDEIMEVHGLTRGEARRWLREFIDHSKRSKLTAGMPEAMVNDGNTESRMRRRKVVIENERRQFITSDGETLIPVPEQAHDPEIHVPSGETLFERALKSREAEKKPYKAKFTKSVRSTPGSKGKRGSKPLDEPRGEQAKKVFQALKECGWKHIEARDKLVQRGVFDHYPAERRGMSALSTVMSVKKRYQARVDK